MFVTRSTGSFVAGGIVHLIFRNAVNHVVFGSLGSGGTDSLVPGVAVHSVPVVGFPVVLAVSLAPECLGYFVGFVFDGPHGSPPLHFSKWGSSVPIHISLSLVLQWHWGLSVLGVVVLSLRGFEIFVGGIGQSFLNSNNFQTFFLLLAMGCQQELGYFLSSGGLLSKVLSFGSFCFSEFVGALGVVKCACTVVLLVLGAGLGLAKTVTLYFFVRIRFLRSSVAFVFLTLGLVLGWVGLD